MLRFGLANPEFHHAGKNGFWVVIECPPVGGGVGSVTAAAPDAVARYTDKDMRVISPCYAPMFREDEKLHAAGKDKLIFKKADGSEDTYPLTYEDTGLSATIMLYDHYGKESPQTVKLLQKFVPVLDENGQPKARHDDPNTPKGHWRYGVDHEYFRTQEKPYTYGKATATGPNPLDTDPYSAMQKSLMLFTKASAMFIPMINRMSGSTGIAANDNQSPTQPELQVPAPGTSALRPFHGGVDYIIANDWHIGPLWDEMPDSDKVGRIFFMHNHYGGEINEPLADQLNLKTPLFLALKHVTSGKPVEITHPYTGQPHYKLSRGDLPPLACGVGGADLVLGNQHYIGRLGRGLLRTDPLLSEQLRRLSGKGRIFDIHHALPGNKFDPLTSPMLQAEEGYVLLKDHTPEALRDFKAKNKLTFQKTMGLTQDPDAVLYMNMGRIDPNQKGSYLMMEEAERFLKAPGHEKAQMFFCFTEGEQNPRAVALAKKLESDPALQGRVKVILDRFISQAHMAAGDFFMMPSMYEPFGQMQLESMAFADIPIGHAVDGLRTTIHDPETVAGANDNAPPEKVSEYGQVGILMDPVPTTPYQKAIAFDEHVRSFKAKMDKDQESENLGHVTKDEAIDTLYYMLCGGHLPKKHEKVLQEAQASFRKALDRSFDLAKNPEKLMQVRMNGMKYVREQHSSEAIAAKYVQAIDQAVEIRDQRLTAEGNAPEAPAPKLVTPVVPLHPANENEPVGQKLAAFA